MLPGSSYSMHPALLAKLAQEHGLRGGLGDAAPAPQQPSSIDQEIDGFLLRSSDPSSSEVADFLRLFQDGAARDAAGRALLARGISASTIANAMRFIDASGKWGVNAKKIYGMLALASAAISAIHGYRRNDSIGWGVVWFAMGTLFPVITPIIAVAQGYGRRQGA